jgi:DNA topoisomerase-1
MPRLRRSDCSAPGISRRRRGRGFEYRNATGERVEDPEVLERIAELGIPPAWREVWICMDALGHLQATGIDAAGRKQYLYHPDWRLRRDADKFDAMLEFAGRLPTLRRRVRRDLAGHELERDRVVALAVRLLDIGCMRIGSDDYARQHGSHGLTTLLPDHVRPNGTTASFDFPGKSGQRIQLTVDDPVAVELLAALRRRRRAKDAPLLAFHGEPPAVRASRRRSWRPVVAEDVNALIKEVTGDRHSAKDFRTWNATVLTAVNLAGAPEPTRARRKRAIDEAIATTARVLGNTPTVCRNSYVDPRLLDRYASSGLQIDPGPGPRDERLLTQWQRRARVERSVLDLLGGEGA